MPTAAPPVRPRVCNADESLRLRRDAIYFALVANPRVGRHTNRSISLIDSAPNFPNPAPPDIERVRIMPRRGKLPHAFDYFSAFREVKKKARDYARELRRRAAPRGGKVPTATWKDDILAWSVHLTRSKATDPPGMIRYALAAYPPPNARCFTCPQCGSWYHESYYTRWGIVLSESGRRYLVYLCTDCLVESIATIADDPPQPPDIDRILIGLGLTTEQVQALRSLHHPETRETFAAHAGKTPEAIRKLITRAGLKLASLGLNAPEQPRKYQMGSILRYSPKPQASGWASGLEHALVHPGRNGKRRGSAWIRSMIRPEDAR